MVPVAYRSPILIAAFFARPTALCAPQRVERSDPIARTEATRGPRRLKGLVMGTQGDGEHPAAGSRRCNCSVVDWITIRCVRLFFHVPEIYLSIYLSVDPVLYGCVV